MHGLKQSQKISFNFLTKWKWKYNLSKHVACSKSSALRETYSNKWHIRKEEKCKISNLSFHLSKQEKEEPHKKEENK